MSVTPQDGLFVTPSFMGEIVAKGAAITRPAAAEHFGEKKRAEVVVLDGAVLTCAVRADGQAGESGATNACLFEEGAGFF